MSTDPAEFLLPRLTVHAQQQLSHLDSQRVIVVGSSGWIGSAAAQQLTALGWLWKGFGSPHSRDPQVSRWRLDEAAALKPDGLVFLAGVPPSRGDLDLATYQSRLNEVSGVLEEAATLPSLNWISYASSGIVEVSQEDTGKNGKRQAYAAAKLREEEFLLRRVQSGTRVLIARVFSISGPFAPLPSNYALFDFIQQSAQGLIKIKSKSPVFRSYVSVVDLAYLLTVAAAAGDSGVRRTGGVVIELADLAREVIRICAPDCSLIVPDRPGPTEEYYGEDADWLVWCARHGVVPYTLREQIDQSHSWIRAQQNTANHH